MDKTIVETVNSRIDELISARNAEIADTQQKLNEAKAAVAEAQTRADAAITVTDLDAFSAAREDEEKGTRAVELYAARLEQLESNGFVDAAEDARIIAQLQRYQHDLRDSATAEIIALLSRVEAIGHQYYRSQGEATEVRKRWNKEISGGFAGEEINDGELRHAIYQMATLYFYRRELGLDAYHGNGRDFWTK